MKATKNFAGKIKDFFVTNYNSAKRIVSGQGTDEDVCNYLSYLAVIFEVFFVIGLVGGLIKKAKTNKE